MLVVGLSVGFGENKRTSRKKKERIKEKEKELLQTETKKLLHKSYTE